MFLFFQQHFIYLFIIITTFIRNCKILNKKGETMKSTVINFVAGPGVGKSVMTSLIFAKLKISGYNAEIVPEYAKQLVWTEEFELLNNQYHVSYYQNKLLNSLVNKTDLLVTDGCLLHGLVYNIINPFNTSNPDKTKRAILDWFNSFNNITIYLERNPKLDYQCQGRIQDLEEAQHIDNLLKFQLFDNKIDYKSFISDESSTDEILDYIINNLNS